MKNILIQATAYACLAMLSGCKAKHEAPSTASPAEAQASVSTVGTNPAVGPSSTEEVADPFAPCLDAAEKAKSVADTEDGLRSVQFLMTCSENYLSSNPSGAHAEDAMRLWYKAIVASNEILHSIEAKKPSETQDVAEAQQRLVSRENVKDLAKENGYIINRAVQYNTIRAVRLMYDSMKASGLKMESALPWFNETNLSRKRTGVWELTMDGSYDDGNFIVVREFGRKDPYFKVAGFGVYGPDVTVTDADQIDTKGWYGPSCKVNVTAADDKPLFYACDAYLSGKATDQMVRDMRKGLEAAMIRKEKERASVTEAGAAN